MNDRELLELAAKAAGMETMWDQARGSKHGWLRARVRDSGPAWPVWDPLHDGELALRLAVMLGMKIVVALGCVRVQCGDVDVFESFPSTDATGYVAACRAIVRAAAEIGRTK